MWGGRWWEEAPIEAALRLAGQGPPADWHGQHQLARPWSRPGATAALHVLVGEGLWIGSNPPGHDHPLLP
jgi:hypothetical protein